MDQYQALQSFLSSRDTQVSPDEFSEPSNRRLAAALSSSSASPADLAVLLRHVLRQESERQGTPQTILVSREKLDLAGTPCGEFGLSYDMAAADMAVVSADKWEPTWAGAGCSSIEEHVMAGTRCRDDQRVPGDPFLACFSHLLGNDPQYQTPGQRQAIRACLSAPPGSTILVNLPTGSGKSLCAYVLSKIPFQESPHLGVNVVVVPTVALALDQEKNISKMLEGPTAYCGGSDEHTAEKNRIIRQRIMDGQQRVVFTSPEALLHSLRYPVYVAARRGYLQSLVIDEAHIVDQWGDDFRPSFQALAGLRTELLRESGQDRFRTLLLSATITRPTLDTLEALFAAPGPFRMVSAVQVRPEPSYWICQCEDEEKRKRILEAVNHLPRPMILYVTTREDAKYWYNTLKEFGYRRMELMTGDTQQSEREKVIAQWREHKADLVVATSAFGLGVDKADIRAVLHACVPESLDRFYQEVGRGGRDGLASLSMLIYSSKDLKVARSLSQKRMISCKRGLQRWESMFRIRSEHLSEERVNVSLRVPPTLGPRDIDMSSDENTMWNARTLNLMARAGLIELCDKAPTPDLEERDAEGEAPRHDTREERTTVRVLKHDHLESTRWDSDVEPVRQAIAQATDQQSELLSKVLDGTQCIAKTLASSYGVGGRAPDARGPIDVAECCAGCPVCRDEGRPSHALPAWPDQWPWDPVDQVGTALSRLFGAGKALAVVVRQHPLSDGWREQVRRLTEWLMSEGVRHYLVSDQQTSLAVRGAHRAKELPVFIDALESYAGPLVYQRPKMPTAVVLASEEDTRGCPRSLLPVGSSCTPDRPTVWVLPHTLSEPSPRKRRMIDILRHPKIYVEELQLI